MFNFRFRNLRVILRKHFTIRTSGVGSTLLTIAEVLVPILIFLLVTYLRSKISTFDKVYVNQTSTTDLLDKNELLTKINVGGTNILFTPDTPFTSNLVREVQLKLNLYNEDIKPFISISELMNYYNNYEYQGTTIVILFNGIDHSVPHHLNYDIKIYEDGVLWKTDKLFMDDFIYAPGMSSENYIEKGFIPVQIALDTSFIELVSKSTFDVGLTFQEFPYPPYLNTDGVTTIFQQVLPFLTIIGFIFICPVTLKRIVLEKSSGLKELLKISGIKSWALWTGWFLNAILINAVSVIFISLILTSKLFSVHYALIEHCNWIVLALFLLLYCCATTTFLFAFSTIFNKGTLAMVLGVLMWIISYIIFIGVAANVDIMNRTIKTLFLLFPTVALYYGYNAISLFEMRETDITLLNLFESPTSSSDDLSLGYVMGMLFVDTILYFLLTLYLDKIWPGPYGISKPWHFIIEKPLKYFKKNSIAEVPESCLLKHYEETNLKPLLRMKNVVKIYDNTVAVNNLTIDIYKGTITSLLGENGAGKSTTMSMLIGLTKVSAGNICVGGHNLNDDIDAARKNVSICTQHDLLYDGLNVMEHLVLFGMLRDLSSKNAYEQARDLLENTLKLKDKENEYVCNLSGGMKRKLSLGIALMGDAEILILDEPTSGIDIEGRREIWDLILSFKATKTILISTHFLEEAEHLSDYIAIMDNARLLCYGTPMYLKNKYNVGYNCYINYTNDKSRDDIYKLVKKHAKDVVFEKKGGKVIHCCLNNEAKKDIPVLLRELEKNRDTLSLSYKLSNTTLEDVYLKVQGKEKTAIKHIDDKYTEGKTGNSWNITHYFIKRYTFLKKKWMQYLCMTLLCILIIFLSLFLSDSGYADLSRDGKHIPLKLNLYGSTDVYYSISGTDKDSPLESYYRNITNSEHGFATKVQNVSETIIEKGVQNIAHYNKRMIIATEFTVENEQPSKVNIMYSTKALHGAPISVNEVMNTLLKYFAGDEYSISTSNTPLHSQTDKKQALNRSEASNLFLWLTLLPIGPLLLVSTVLMLPTIEYSKSTRIIDKLCGITSVQYWFLNFVCDALFYLGVIVIVFVCLLLAIICVDINVITLETAVTFLIILLIYGLTCIPFAYYFTFTKTVESAYAKFLIIHILLAPIITGILLVWESLEEYKVGGVDWKYIFILDPHVVLCYLLSKFSVKIISNHNWDIMPAERKRFLCHENPVPCCEPESQECAATRAYIEDYRFILLTLGVAIVYLGILAFYERIFKFISDVFACRVKSCCSYDGPTSVGEGDVDAKIIAADCISKTFYTFKLFRMIAKQAIKELTFNVKKGNCFGLLGVNGAGKTTSFRLLTNEIQPTSGKLSVPNKTVGYCPQHDALIDDFTGREILQQYGKLRQITDSATVNMLLEKFGLTAIADKPCGTYSGGNKRKLSICVSVIGGPNCILFDEPTAGVDPVSRRELWDLIEQIKQERETGIILTSHSMDECEALCDSVCILKEGAVAVNDSIEQLKMKYCVGHVIKVKLGTDVNNSVDCTDGNTTSETNIKDYHEEEIIQTLLCEYFAEENIKMLGRHNALIHIRILKSDWPTIIEKMEKIKTDKESGIDDYWVKEASLEDVFLSIARQK